MLTLSPPRASWQTERGTDGFAEKYTQRKQDFRTKDGGGGGVRGCGVSCLLFLHVEAYLAYNPWQVKEPMWKHYLRFYRRWRSLWARLCNSEDTWDTNTFAPHYPRGKMQEKHAVGKMWEFQNRNREELLNPTLSKVFLRHQLSRMPTLLCSFYQETCSYVAFGSKPSLTILTTPIETFIWLFQPQEGGKLTRDFIYKLWIQTCKVNRTKSKWFFFSDPQQWVRSSSSFQTVV